MHEFASFSTAAKHSNLSRAISNGLQEFLECFDISEAELLLIREDLGRKFDELIIEANYVEEPEDPLESEPSDDELRFPADD